MRRLLPAILLATALTAAQREIVIVDTDSGLFGDDGAALVMLLRSPAQASVAGVTIDMAPQASRDAIAEFGRAKYAGLIANNPIELPLDAAGLVYAFRRWDEQVGAKVGK